MILRRLNASGIAAFKSFLTQSRAQPDLAVPRILLEDDSFTEPVTPKLDVEVKQFASRREAADYLTKLLEPLPEDDVAKNSGLWTWLSLFFFDEVCQLRQGKRVVRNDYSYVFEPRNARHFYRHLLFIAWYATRLAKPFDRLYSTNPLFSLDKVTTEVMKRLYLTRIPCVFEVLDRLYWDEERGRSRVGIVDSRNVKPGDLVHRFPIRMRQLEKTYDLFSLTADQLVELLGAEFQQTEIPAGRQGGSPPERAPV